MRRSLLAAAAIIPAVLALLPSAAAGGGLAVGHLAIPRIGLSTDFYAGTTEDVLSEGPGHYAGTRWPGAGVGTVGIAGHRTWNPHPFNRLDELRPDHPGVSLGDAIIVQYRGQRIVYRVHEVRIVSQYDTAFMWGRYARLAHYGPHGLERLVLSACSRADGTPTSWDYRILAIAYRA